jgi:integrase/recombinase XerC
MPLPPEPVSLQSAPITAVDVMPLFLAEKQNPATRRAYAIDLRDFFGQELKPERVAAFLALPAPMLSLRLFTYKAELLARGASQATVNRRLSVLRSVLKFAHRLGLASSDGRGLVEGEKLRSTDDRPCLEPRLLRRLVAVPGQETVRSRRDTAILRLLCENALRRSELCALKVADFAPAERRLLLTGQLETATAEWVPLSRPATDAIAAYLETSDHPAPPTAPLFRNVDHRPGVAGERLTPDGLYFLVREYGRMVGLEELTPRRLRESAIAAALEGSHTSLRRVLSQRSAVSRRLSSPAPRRAAGEG